VPRSLADRLWDAATDPAREDIPQVDNDSHPSDRGYLRSPVVAEATRMLWIRSSLKRRVIMEDTESAKATAETWTADRGIAIFTDGSKFEDGDIGCGAVCKSGDGWRRRKVFMGRNKEVFDAELYDIWIGLVSARDRRPSCSQAGKERRPGPRTMARATDSPHRTPNPSGWVDY
jgi:hypothetical protein